MQNASQRTLVSSLPGRVRVASLTLLDRPGKCGDNGELDVGKEYLRAPNGVHWARADRRAERVESVMVANGANGCILPFIDMGVSGPTFMGWWKFCVVRPDIMEGLRELIDGGGVEKYGSFGFFCGKL